MKRGCPTCAGGLITDDQQPLCGSCRAHYEVLKERKSEGGIFTPDDDYWLSKYETVVAGARRGAVATTLVGSLTALFTAIALLVVLTSACATSPVVSDSTNPIVVSSDEWVFNVQMYQKYLGDGEYLKAATLARDKRLGDEKVAEAALAAYNYYLSGGSSTLAEMIGREFKVGDPDALAARRKVEEQKQLLGDEE